MGKEQRSGREKAGDGQMKSENKELRVRRLRKCKE